MYAGIVYDALNTLGVGAKSLVLNPSIYPLNDKHSIFGKVFTTKGYVVGPEDYDLWDKKRLEIPKAIEDETIVALSSNDNQVAHAGDITLRIYKDSGIEGFVTDGLVRDSNIIKHEMDYPCFCMGTTPIDAVDYWALTEYQVKIYMSGLNKSRVLVQPGDYIYADSDGALVIPRQIMPNPFMETLSNFSEWEEEIRSKVSNKPLKELFEEYGRW